MTPEKIDDLIRRYRANECTPEEEKIIDEFLDSFQDESTEWDEEFHGNKEETESRIYSDIIGNIGFPDKRPLLSFQLWHRAAAILLILVTFFYLFTKNSSETSVKDETPETLVVKTITRGQKSIVHLIDGSVIYINSDTKISYPKKFAGGKREIHLEGEAFFEVSSDPANPFIVHTGTLVVKALGTAFNINTFEDKITVTLTAGKVGIQSTNPSISYSGLGMLAPNQQFVYNKTDNSIKVNEVDVEPYIAWTKKQLVFREEPILSVVKKLEKWYDVEITFENENIKNCIFTGIFDNEPLKLVLESLHTVAGINYTIEGRKVRLTGTGCYVRK